MIPHDPVNRPDYYNQGDIECIDAIRAALGPEGFLAFCRGNAIKYAWRLGKKNAAVQDAGQLAYYSRKAEQTARELESHPELPLQTSKGG